MGQVYDQKSKVIDKFFEKSSRSNNKKGESEVERFKNLRKQGYTLKKISEITGFAVTTIKRRLDPTMQERYRKTAAEWERKNRPPGCGKYDYKKTAEGKKRAKDVAEAYKKTPRGFFTYLYNSKVGSIKRIEKLKKYHETVPIITFEEFMEVWQKHVRNYGTNCYYTGVPLTFYDPDNQAAPTLCSVDRFDSEKGYTKDNIVFCSWDFNNRKSAISIEDCYIIIKRHRERTQREPQRLYFNRGGLVT